MQKKWFKAYQTQIGLKAQNTIAQFAGLGYAKALKERNSSLGCS